VLPDISNVPENLESILLGFVNRGLASFLEQSKSNTHGDISDFIDDLRMCTVLFVSLQGLAYNSKVKFETESIQQVSNGRYDYDNPYLCWHLRN